MVYNHLHCFNLPGQVLLNYTGLVVVDGAVNNGAQMTEVRSMSEAEGGSQSVSRSVLSRMTVPAL